MNSSILFSNIFIVLEYRRLIRISTATRNSFQRRGRLNLEIVLLNKQFEKFSINYSEQQTECLLIETTAYKGESAAFFRFHGTAPSVDKFCNEF